MVMVNTAAGPTLPGPAGEASVAAVDDSGRTYNGGDSAALAGALGVVCGRGTGERCPGGESGRDSDADARGADTGHLSSPFDDYGTSLLTVMTLGQNCRSIALQNHTHEVTG